MTKIRIICSSLLLVLAFSTVVIPGCGKKETAPATTTPVATPATTTVELTQQQLQKIYSDSMLALKDINTYKFDMDMDMIMEIAGGDESGKVNIDSTMTGANNQATHEMFMIIDMSMGSDISSMDINLQNMSMEMYVLKDTMYMKVDVPKVGAQWVKMPYSEEMEKMYSLDMVDQQLELLESVTDIKFVKYETLDGSECYVLSIIPDMKEIMSWVGEELPTELDTTTIDQVSKIFKDLLYNVWIARDTGLMLKMDARMRMDISADMFDGGEDTDFNKMTMDITMTMKMYDHNKPVSIVLPAEAENAMEMPGATR